mgnify:CR=1 FL=1
MELARFFRNYGDEESCTQLFKEFRDRQGVICKGCKGKDHIWIRTVRKYECKSCHFQTTLRSGTILHASKLPYHYWIYAIVMMTYTKKSISALEMQRQLGHKRYEPIWAMMHKIRRSMGDRDSRYQLEELVELDDGFVKSFKDKDENDSNGNKAGRGTQENSNILVMCRVSSGKDDSKKKKDTAFRYVKMRLTLSQKAEEFEKIVEQHIDPETCLMSDGFPSFSKLDSKVKSHLQLTVSPKLGGKVLPWVHTTISNLKRQLLGVHSGVKQSYLQNYLDEFCYKTNRRYFGFKLFDRVMVAAVTNHSKYGSL